VLTEPQKQKIRDLFIQIKGIYWYILIIFVL
jgi:hypothetical protein